MQLEQCYDTVFSSSLEEFSELLLNDLESSGP